jgi:hypothetical protein
MRDDFMWPIGTQVYIPDFKANGEIIHQLSNNLYEIQVYKGPIIVTRTDSFKMITYPYPPIEGDLAVIRMDKLIDGGLYYIDARNAEYGIWLYNQLGFIIRRLKFTNIFLFVEYHYDTGSPFGTVKPKIFLEKCPFSIEALQIQTNDINDMGYTYEDIILEYLKRKEEYYGKHPKK